MSARFYGSTLLLNAQAHENDSSYTYKPNCWLTLRMSTTIDSNYLAHYFTTCASLVNLFIGALTSPPPPHRRTYVFASHSSPTQQCSWHMHVLDLHASDTVLSTRYFVLSVSMFLYQVLWRLRNYYVHWWRLNTSCPLQLLLWPIREKGTVLLLQVFYLQCSRVTKFKLFRSLSSTILYTQQSTKHIFSTCKHIPTPSLSSSGDVTHSPARDFSRIV